VQRILHITLAAILFARNVTRPHVEPCTVIVIAQAHYLTDVVWTRRSRQSYLTNSFSTTYLSYPLRCDTRFDTCRESEAKTVALTPIIRIITGCRERFSRRPVVDYVHVKHFGPRLSSDHAYPYRARRASSGKKNRFLLPSARAHSETTAHAVYAVGPDIPNMYHSTHGLLRIMNRSLASGVVCLNATGENSPNLLFQR
jgi:hypothetical protein